MSNFPCSLTRSMTSHSMENLTFHSLLRWKMIILQIFAASLIQLLLKGWENEIFELGTDASKPNMRIDWKRHLWFFNSHGFVPEKPKEKKKCPVLSVGSLVYIANWKTLQKLTLAGIGEWRPHGDEKKFPSVQWSKSIALSGHCGYWCEHNKMRA